MNDTGARRALRLVLAYDERGLHLAGVIPRAKAVPVSADVHRVAPVNAVTVEVRLRGGATVYRRVLREPIPQSVEVFDEGGPRRLPTAPPTGAFSVVVPAVDQAADVVIEAGPDVELRQPAFARAAGEPQRRRELARFALPQES